MKVYRLYLSRPLLILYLLLVLSWPFVGVAGIAAAALGAFGPDKSAMWMFVIVLGISLLTSYMSLRYPFEIKVDEGTIEFRSLVRKTVVPVAEVRSVRAKRNGIGFVDLRHGSGTVHLVSQMDGFYDFLWTLKSLNPAVKIEGC